MVNLKKLGIPLAIGAVGVAALISSYFIKLKQQVPQKNQTAIVATEKESQTILSSSIKAFQRGNLREAMDAYLAAETKLNLLPASQRSGPEWEQLQKELDMYDRHLRNTEAAVNYLKMKAAELEELNVQEVVQQIIARKNWGEAVPGRIQLLGPRGIEVFDVADSTVKNAMLGVYVQLLAEWQDLIQKLVKLLRDAQASPEAIQILEKQVIPAIIKERASAQSMLE